VYWAATVTTDTFAKPGEPMPAAIKRFMSLRKRERNTVRRSFPKFAPGMTTNTYVQLYYMTHTPGSHRGYIVEIHRPAPMPVGPEVEEHIDA